MMDWLKNVISDIKFNITNSIESIITIINDNRTAIFAAVGVGLLIFIIYSIIMDDDYLRWEER